MDNQTKEIGKILIEFYDTMYRLDTREPFASKEGKKATKLIMTINDLVDLINSQNAELVDALTVVMPYLDMVLSHVNLSDDSLEEFIEARSKAQQVLKSHTNRP